MNEEIKLATLEYAIFTRRIDPVDFVANGEPSTTAGGTQYIIKQYLNAAFFSSTSFFIGDEDSPSNKDMYPLILEHINVLFRHRLTKTADEHPSIFKIK